VCKISDVVAYINHDIDDAIRAGVIIDSDLPQSSIHFLGHSRSERINTMVCDIVENSWPVREGKSVEKLEIRMSNQIREATRELHEFLYQFVYNISSARPEAENARRVIRFLYRSLKAHPDRFPSEYFSSEDNLERQIVDYIAGMTDHFALSKAQELGF